MSESISDKNFVVYKSSAGSGKTFTLVKEYLLLALKDASVPPQAYRHILAITFTNKAAAEMKERIIKALKDLSADDYTQLSKNAQSLLNAIKQDAPFLTDDIIKARTKNILTAILHNYSDFGIGTIDSFVHKIVRTFAFDLKIPLSFEIETDSEKLLTQSIDLLISKIGSDDKLTKILVEYAENKTDDDKSWHIEKDLKQFALNLLNEEGSIHIEKLKNVSIDDFFEIKDTLRKHILEFEKNISDEAQKAVELISKAGLSSEIFYQGNKGIAAYFSNLAQKEISKIEYNSYVSKTIDEDKWYSTNADATAKNAIDGIKTKLLSVFNSIQKLKEENYSEYVLFSIINKNIYSLAVLNEIEKLMIEYKTENSIVHISDFNKKIAEIVLTQPVPYIYERLGERYKNYLIDEFQDTSVLQFQNLLPLIDNSLSENHFTMLVGDGKQAIYRWRGGEVEQFDSLPNITTPLKNAVVAERENSLKRNYSPKKLYKNYRSKKEIIAFNNSFFRTLANTINDKQKSIYEGLEQEFDPANTGGYVQVEFINEEKEAKEEKNLLRILEIINDLKKDDFDYKDIAILVRTNKDGSNVANFLSKHTIPIISSDSLLLNNSKEIQFIVSLLKYITRPSENIIQAEIIEYLIQNNFFKKTDIHAVLKEKAKTDFVSLLKENNIQLHSYRLSKMALYELCETLIQLFKLHEQPNAYLQFFMDEVHQYSQKANNSISDFIEYWEDKKEKASVILPQGIDAINIMTIHRSKGLEFPVVILPFMDDKIDIQKKNSWIDLDNKKIEKLKSAIVNTSKELEATSFAHIYTNEKNKSLLDNLNLLYVALTRPELQLYILTGKIKEPKEEMNNTTDFFIKYYQLQNQLDTQKNIYTFGEKQKRQGNKKTATSNTIIRSFNATNWRDIIKMRAAAPSIWNTQFAQNKRDFGVLLHTALAKIEYKNQAADALNSMLHEGLITDIEKEILLPKIQKIIEHPQLEKYFTNDYSIKNESEIITAAGKLYRTDRVAIKDKTATIIDYKTGEKKNGHKKQIDEYALLLKEMGYSIIETLLVYINDDTIEIVS